jgi:HAD superfamily hydrolase (TIGR01490 family)
MKKKSIALFDFDGTVTNRDTLLEFIKYHNGTISLMMGILILSPLLLALKLNLLNRQLVKEKFLSFFLKGEDVVKFNNSCLKFIDEKFNRLLRADALEKINWHKENGHTVCIVSASPRNWIEPWCLSMNIYCIATELEAKENKLTGKIIGKNCYGQEKVTRINSAFQLTEFIDTYAYGDSKGDLQMLSLAKYSFYKPF